jgi:hypothetical protein
MERKNLTVRTVYLYVATLVGLGLLIAGGVQAFELILKATILTQADAEEELWARQPPVPYSLDRVQELDESAELTDSEREAIRSWLADYERWQEQQAAVDTIAARRQRQLATALSLVLVGVPVYAYHWSVIRRDLGRPGDRNGDS